MSKRPFIVFGLFAAICLLVIPFIALGKEGDEDAGDGPGRLAGPRGARTCSPTTAAPATRSPPRAPTASSGPNLDELLVPSGTNTRRALRGQRHPRAAGGHVRRSQGRMPKGILEEEEAQEVAAVRRRLRRPDRQGPGGRHRRRAAARAPAPARGLTTRARPPPRLDCRGTPRLGWPSVPARSRIHLLASDSDFLAELELEGARRAWRRRSESTSGPRTRRWPCSRAASRRSSRTPRAGARPRRSSRSPTPASASSAPWPSARR